MPVCFVSRTGRAIVRMATCTCARGAYEAQFRTRRDEARHRGPYETFTLEDAQRLGLLSPTAHSRVEHLHHALARERELSTPRENTLAIHAEP